jgi:thioredoxin 1
MRHLTLLVVSFTILLSVCAADTPAAVSVPDQGDVILKFEADWCGPCKELSATLATISGELQKIQIIPIDVDREPVMKRQYGVTHIPCLVLFRDGQQLARIVGAKASDELLLSIQEVFAKGQPEKATELPGNDRGSELDGFWSVPRRGLSQLELTFSKQSNDLPEIRFVAESSHYRIPAATIARYSSNGKASAESALAILQAIQTANVVSVIADKSKDKDFAGNTLLDVLHLQLMYRDQQNE